MLLKMMRFILAQFMYFWDILKSHSKRKKLYKSLHTHSSSLPKTEFLSDTLNGNILASHSFIQKSCLTLPMCHTCSDHPILDLIWHLSSNEVEAFIQELEIVCVIRIWQPKGVFFEKCCLFQKICPSLL